MKLDKLKYPVGKFSFPTDFNDDILAEWIALIEQFPDTLKNEVVTLKEELDWRYRPEGWNIRQVVHHCADSHMNAFCRFKLTLTEDSLEVKGYFEDRWAELADTTDTPIDWSLDILSGLHSRWITLIKSLNEDELLKTYYHSEYKKTFELRQVIALYAWHCRHHVAHVVQAKNSQGEYN